MNATTMWWLLAGALVALELMTGTFYLLMLAIGAAAGALAALAGLDLTAQVVTAAAVGGLAVVLWSFGRPQKSAAEASQDQGQRHVLHDVEHRDQARPLEDQSGRRRCGGAAGAGCDDRAGRGLLEPGQQVQQRRLPAP